MESVDKYAGDYTAAGPRKFPKKWKGYLIENEMRVILRVVKRALSCHGPLLPLLPGGRLVPVQKAVKKTAGEGLNIPS